MRVNVYAEEMTDRIEIIGKEIDGHTFTGLRFYLELPATLPERTDWSLDGMGNNVRGPFIHRPGDDDSAAVTFWGKRDLRVVLLKALGLLDAHYVGLIGTSVGDPPELIVAVETLERLLTHAGDSDWTRGDVREVIQEALARIQQLRKPKPSIPATGL